MLIKKAYKETELLKRKLIPKKRLLKQEHYTKKTFKIKTQKTEDKFNEGFGKWMSL